MPDAPEPLDYATPRHRERLVEGLRPASEIVELLAVFGLAAFVAVGLFALLAVTVTTFVE
jgi:hypothetical protein